MLLKQVILAIGIYAVSISLTWADDREIDRLIASWDAETPLIDDLRHLSDVIGGRTTGTDANARAVDWAVERFKEAGVTAREESFKMPRQWVEISTEVTIRGKQVDFSPRAVAKQYSKTTRAKDVSGPVVSVGFGTSKEFQSAGSAVGGAWLLVDTNNVIDLAGLFGEYAQSIEVERLAAEHGALGIIYVAPRPNGLLHRLVLFSGVDLPVLFVEREEGLRIGRLLEDEHELTATINIDAHVSGAFDSFNVVGEIYGSDLGDEIVLIGAHLDSHNLGTGAIDNGGNVSILIDVARQMVQHNIRTRRTLRFVLWNGEEQGFIGSWAYTQKHALELPQHVMAASIDVGEGPINGFYMNGRGDELREILDRTLRPVAGLGSFEHADAAVVGTDNYDFMLNGVANLVSLQNSPELGPNYHAESDTFDKVDPAILKRNAKVVAALAYGFANEDIKLPRQSAQEVESLIKRTDLKSSMEMFGVYEPWLSKQRTWIPRASPVF